MCASGFVSRSRARFAFSGGRDVVDRSRASEAAAHPVAAALLDTITKADLSRAIVGDLIDARRLSLYDEPPADVAALDRHLIALRGTPIRLAARVLGETNETVETAAAEAGVALGIMDLLLALPQTSESRRVLLPVDLLSRYGVSQGEIDAGRSTPGAALVLADLRAMARARIAALRAKRKQLGNAGPAFMTASLVEPRLKLNETHDPFGVQVDLPQWRRQWILWRASRRGVL